MPPSYFPLRWESTGDQWWYAYPIDWAAANGLYDLVKELLYLDTNLLIKLTSLRRIRRLETVWDDEASFNDVSKCRSKVARNLLHDCETQSGFNSLLRAGYGGWLLYTAASAGDMCFVKELLGRDTSLVFGYGEYGVTDILYAAARSKDYEVFRLLLDVSLLPGNCVRNGGEEEVDDEKPSERGLVFKWEMMNRGVHAAARGGNFPVLKELLGNKCDILAYRDAQGSTILHSAAGQGQVKVVRYLLASFDNIVAAVDDQGNTALHIASYWGHLPVVEILVHASSSLVSSTNKNGDSFLHMAVAGFQSPGFRRLDKHIEFMKQLICGKFVDLQNIINVRNNDGRTVLHMAMFENIQCDLVEMLMSVPSIDVNIQDVNGITPLDVLKQGPRSPFSEILIKQLISAGGISNHQDHMARSAIVTQLKAKGIVRSPGTSFTISDAEIFLFTGNDNDNASNDNAEISACSRELSNSESPNVLHKKKSGSISHTARRLRYLLRWPGRKERKAVTTALEDDESLESYSLGTNFPNVSIPIPLRQRYLNPTSLPNNQRTLHIRSTYLPSPATKRKFTAGLMHGVIQVMPHWAYFSQSPPSAFSGLSGVSPAWLDTRKDLDGVESCCSNGSLIHSTPDLNKKHNSCNKKLMNHYLCFGAQDLALDDSPSCRRSNHSQNHFSSSSSPNINVLKT